MCAAGRTRGALAPLLVGQIGLTVCPESDDEVRRRGSDDLKEQWPWRRRRCRRDPDSSALGPRRPRVRRSRVGNRFVAGYPVKLLTKGVAAADEIALVTITNKDIGEFYPPVMIPANTYDTYE